MYRVPGQHKSVTVKAWLTINPWISVALWSVAWLRLERLRRRLPINSTTSLFWSLIFGPKKPRAVMFLSENPFDRTTLFIRTRIYGLPVVVFTYSTVPKYEEHGPNKCKDVLLNRTNLHGLSRRLITHFCHCRCYCFLTGGQEQWLSWKKEKADKHQGGWGWGINSWSPASEVLMIPQLSWKRFEIA